MIKLILLIVLLSTNCFAQENIKEVDINIRKSYKIKRIIVIVDRMIKENGVAVSKDSDDINISEKDFIKFLKDNGIDKQIFRQYIANKI